MRRRIVKKNYNGVKGAVMIGYYLPTRLTKLKNVDYIYNVKMLLIIILIMKIILTHNI